MSDAPKAAEIGRPAPSPEAGGKPSVLEVFNRSFAAYDQAMQSLAATPDLNEDQMLQLFRYEECTKKGKEEALDKGQRTITHNLRDPKSGQEFTSREGIAVEGLISFLESQAAGEPDNAKKADIYKDLAILHGSLKSFNAAHADQINKDPKYLEARKAFEAQAFFQFRSRHAFAGSEGRDWEIADRILNSERFELNLPEGDKKPEAAISDEALQQIREAERLEEIARRPSHPPEDIDSSHLESRFVAERFYQDNIDSPEAKVSELEEARKNKKEGKLY
ncbi:hypothetical protein HY612_02905, partial [Candidatus Roizmanbacteria bacterium]|nr:hypothetical protein [Candidatus Roizmanbacteria bacterium]